MNTLNNTTYPLTSVALVSEKRRLEISFGDGYKQIAEDGINTNKEKWAIRFEPLTTTSADTLVDWFNDNSTDGFYWVKPGATTSGIYTIEAGTLNMSWIEGSRDLWEVSTTLERIYRLV